ncbi:hypothetical protein [Hymenobacter crusticola]|uniref:hypothetical protein n=1 Tax=Hymenobacter crusticola TaxID=1770526 RepID=UPI000A36F3D4|nr:hypothetical protein [Hymenobacter crusticola]
MPSIQTIPAPIAALVSDGALTIGGFLQVLQASSTYIFVEALAEGSFSWIFSQEGTVTGVRLIHLLAGQRAQAYASRPHERISIQCP